MKTSHVQVYNQLLLFLSLCSIVSMLFNNPTRNIYSCTELALRGVSLIIYYPGNTTTVKKRISNVSERLVFSLKYRVF